jgi:hypothetical protein
MMKSFLCTLVLAPLVIWKETDAGSPTAPQKDRRGLANYYHSLTTANLGELNLDAAIGNPLKGLVTSPFYSKPPYTADIPQAVEFYYVGA